MCKQNGGLAYPRPASKDERDGTLSDGDRVVGEQSGMTMRQWYKGQALIGFMAAFGNASREVKDAHDVIDIAIKAGVYADAMIKEDEDA